MLDENSVLDDIFRPLREIQAEKLALKITKFLGGKSVNELIVCKIWSFQTRFPQKVFNTSAQIPTVCRTMSLQYCSYN